MIKRRIDFIVSLITLIVISPLFLILAILIKLDSKGPVFFIQKRVGKNGKLFNFYKFRTMVDDAEKVGLKEGASEKDPRITKLGKFLREWTIDESPQFINILKGDMSLVGPRPLSLYNKGNTHEMEKLWQKRISIKPGLVSIVDIRGRNLVPWEKRFEYDAWYIDHQSLWLDLKILVSGFFAVLGRKGVYGEGGTNKTNISEPSGIVSYVKKREQEKERNKKKIMEMFRNKDMVTNQEVEEMLKVSDATATRYLDELEKGGKLVQKGGGVAIYYTKR